MAQKRAHKTRKAKNDLSEIAAWYGRDSVELELRFLTAAEDAFRNLLHMPRRGALREFFHPALKGVRMWPIPTFPQVLIFYRPIASGIEVIRVLHIARDIAGLFSKEGEVD